MESNENAVFNVTTVYDVGNTSYYGHNVEAELLLLHERSTHIHIKGKNYFGENTLLGSNIINFTKFLNHFCRLSTKGFYLRNVQR